MAWGQKYEAGCKDKYGKIFRAKFYYDGYASSVTTYLGTALPIQFNFLNESDDVFEPVRPSDVSINLEITEQNYTIGTDFCSLEKMACLVKIFDETVSTTTPYWMGYVDPSQISEDYDIAPYSLEVTCVDGLILLKDIPFYDTIEDLIEDSGTYYDGRKYLSEILIIIFGKIGYTEFKEFINIYEINMLNSVDDSPFDQLSIDVDVFQDKTCDEVLQEILRIWNAWIRQKDGVFQIIRPVDVLLSTNYGRYFTAAFTKTSVSYTPTTYINRPTNVTSYQQVPGGKKLGISPAKKITINQDYGYKESWINNWELKGTQYTYPNKWQGWTGAMGWLLTETVPEEKNGLTITAVSVRRNYSVYQVFGVNLKTTSNVIGFSFEYYLYAYLGSTITGVYIDIQIKHNITGKYLYVIDEEKVGWSASTAYITIGPLTIANGRTPWTTFSRTLATGGMPGDGECTVTLYSPYSASSFAFLVAYQNIKFYSTSAKVVTKRFKRKLKNRITFEGVGDGSRLTLKNKYYYVKYKEEVDNIVEHIFSVFNGINGNELDYDYILGDIPTTSSPASDADTGLDNIIEQFKGALAVVFAALSQVAAKFVTDHAADYSPGGVVVSQGTGIHTNDIIMTSSVAGVNFTGATSVTNTRGTLAGSVVNTQANAAEQTAVDTISLSGTGGTANISCNGVTRLCTFGGTLNATASAFAADAGNIAAFAAVGIILSYGGGNNIVFSVTPAGTFGTHAAIANVTPNLNGSYADTYSYSPAVKRIDTITLSSSDKTGAANILCDGVTKEALFIMTPSTLWNTRTPGGENLPLLQLIANEIAKQYSRPKKLIQMPIQEMALTNPSINILGNLQDDMMVDEYWFMVKTIDSSWDVYHCTHTIVGGYARIITSDTDPSLIKQNTLALVGAICRILSIRYRIISGNPGAWGFIYYGISGGHAKDGGYYNAFAINADGAWHTLLIDMGNLTVGGNDWVTHIITKIWFDITENAGVTYELDWIGFNRVFAISRGSKDARNSKWELDLVEILK